MAAAAVICFGANLPNNPDDPQYTADGRMILPKNYREWVFLSSGLGMTYGPLGAASEHPEFDNVFVTHSAYQSFLRTGNWPDKAVLILEVRDSESKGSINKGGHFQTGIMGIEAHVKDEARFEGGWEFFGFGNGATTAKAVPTTAGCHSCHKDHGAVDNTFVQFYPTLLEIAKAKGTLTKN